MRAEFFHATLIALQLKSKTRRSGHSESKAEGDKYRTTRQRLRKPRLAVVLGGKFGG